MRTTTTTTMTFINAGVFTRMSLKDGQPNNDLSNSALIARPSKKGPANDNGCS
jgi:hypothetical protein